MFHSWPLGLLDKQALLLDKSSFNIKLCSWWDFVMERGDLENLDVFNSSDLALEVPQEWSWGTDQPLYQQRKERPEVFWRGKRKINTCYTMLNKAPRVYKASAHRDIHFEGLLNSNPYLDFPSSQLLTKQLLFLSQESSSCTHRVPAQNTHNRHSNFPTKKTSNYTE